MQVEKTVWLTRPDELKKIDFRDPKSVDEHSYLCETGMDMTSSGWTRLGDATITFNNLINPNTVAVAAAAQIDKAIEGLRVETETKINEFLRVKQELLCLEAPAAAPELVNPLFVPMYLDPEWREWSTCIKTGCALFFKGRYFWGDLWVGEGGDYYLFNGTSLMGSEEPEASTYLVTVSASAFPEQMGTVIQASVGECSLSPELIAYLEKGFSND